MNKKLNLLLNLLQRPIALHPSFIKLAGSLSGGVVLSQLFYWWRASGCRKFYKTDEDITKETFVSEWEIRQIKKELRKLPFLKITVSGLPAKTYYEFDPDLLYEYLANLIPDEIGETHETSSDETTQQVRMEPQNKFREIHQTNTENNTESNTENKKIKIKNGDFIENLLEIFIKTVERKFGIKYFGVKEKDRRGVGKLVGLFREETQGALSTDDFIDFFEKRIEELCDIARDNEFLAMNFNPMGIVNNWVRFQLLSQKQKSKSIVSTKTIIQTATTQTTTEETKPIYLNPIQSNISEKSCVSRDELLKTYRKMAKKAEEKSKNEPLNSVVNDYISELMKKLDGK